MSTLAPAAHQRAEHLSVGRQRRVGRRRGSARRSPSHSAFASAAYSRPDAGARQSPSAASSAASAEPRVADERQRPVFGRVERLDVEADEAPVRVLEQRPGAGGEVGEPRADGEHDVGFLGEAIGGVGAGDADGAHVQRMVGRRRRFAGLGLGDRNAVLVAEGDQLALRRRNRARRRRRRRAASWPRARAPRHPASSRASGALAAQAMHALVEEALGVVERFGLDVLAEGERHRAAFGRVGQHRDRARQRRHDLLGPHDAVEIARDRAEAIVGAHRAVAEILDLLQHRIGAAIGEDVARQQQHRQPIDMRDRGGGDHVGRAGADRAGAGHHAPAAR